MAAASVPHAQAAPLELTQFAFQLGSSYGDGLDKLGAYFTAAPNFAAFNFDLEHVPSGPLQLGYVTFNDVDTVGHAQNVSFSLVRDSTAPGNTGNTGNTGNSDNTGTSGTSDTGGNPSSPPAAPNAVPEPGSLALAGLGLGLAALTSCRRKRRQA